MDHHARDNRASKRPRVQVAPGATPGDSLCALATVPRTEGRGEGGGACVGEGPALGEWRCVVLAEAELSEQDAAVRQVADDVADRCSESGQKFVDLEFPPCVSSVDGRPPNKLRWVCKRFFVLPKQWKLRTLLC